MAKVDDQSARPVIFGEVLFDHYPDGNKSLAGAPLGVAWHLQGFGLRPILITRIGQDSEGELALTAMHQWGLDTRAVQIDHQHATGSVEVIQENGENHFVIKPGQAWDFISSALVMEWVNTLPCSLIYAGSLAQRSHISHKTLQRLMLETQLPVYIDINLREPWAESAIINQSLDAAHWLKLSDSELQILTQLETTSVDATVLAGKRLKSRHDIDTLYITRAEHGAIVINDATCIDQDIEKNISLVDSVGAGDAFTAVCILGLHKGWNEAQVLKRANQFASIICQRQGATSLDKQDYSELLRGWR